MPIAGDIYYYDSKKGESTTAIILIHGAGGMHLHWPYNLRRINNHRVYAPDLPGHGKSDGLGEQSIEKYAATIAKWMDKLSLKKAIIVGHSMGGAIAQQFTLSFPEKVAGLVLVGTGAKLQVSQDLLLKLSTPATTPTAIENIIKWSYAPGMDKKLLEKMQEQLSEVRSAVLYGDYLACNNFDLTDHINTIKVPTLIICGEMDKMTPIYLSQQLQSLIPNTRLQLIPDAGHMVMLEKPDAVAMAVQEFMQEIN
jgi:pimeloyl-ACP methyl ester carboxylesterase